MFDNKLQWVGLGLGCVLGLAACPGDDSAAGETGSQETDTAAETDTAVDTDPTAATGTTMAESSGGPVECLGIGGPSAAGDSCTSNADCMSGVCLAFQDVPPDPNAVCGEEPPECATHVTATLYDFSALVDAGAPAPLAGTDVDVIPALEAIAGVGDATPVASATSDGDGRVDVVSDGPINAAIAIVAVAGGGDYFPTATGVASEIDGRYEVGTGIHEFWTVRTSTLDAWTEALREDPETMEAVGENGLGGSGGVVGFVRDAEGNPVEGATVTPDADSSGALIRYPQDDGSMGTDGTGPSGTFVVLGPSQTGEDFTAEAGGQSGGGTAGTANGVVFSLILGLS